MKTKHIIVALIIIGSFAFYKCSPDIDIDPIKIDLCNDRYSVFLYLTDCDGIPHEIGISKEELGRLGMIKANSSDLCIPVTVNPLNSNEPRSGYIKSSINIFCSI